MKIELTASASETMTMRVNAREPLIAPLSAVDHKRIGQLTIYSETHEEAVRLWDFILQSYGTAQKRASN